MRRSISPLILHPHCSQLLLCFSLFACDILCRHRRGDWPSFFGGNFDPSTNRIAQISDCLFRGLAIGHATWKLKWNS